LAAGSLLARKLPGAVVTPLAQGRAEHVISIWLGGGMGQIDSFDPKRKHVGPYHDSVDTAVPITDNGSPISSLFA